MGKPKPLPAVAEVPPEALAEDRRRAEAMVALVKEMTKGEDRRERLLRRARPSDQKTLLKRFERERARDAQRIRELSQEREALLRASVRDAAAAAAPPPARDLGGDSDDEPPPPRTLDFSRPAGAPKNLMAAQKLAQEKEIIDKFNRLCRPGPPRRARAAAPPASTRRTARAGGGATARRTAALMEKRTLLVRLQGIVEEESALRAGGATTRRSTARSVFRTPARPSSARSVATTASFATVGSRAGAPPPRPRGVPRLRL